METLPRDTERDVTVAAPGEDPSPEAPPRMCATCGSAMAADQDWCLECGTARAGRLGRRPGWRAAGAVSGLTLVLVAGAVAASYAALTDDANKDAAQPAPPSAAPIAQAPAQVASPPATTTVPATATPRTPKVRVKPRLPGATATKPVVPVPTKPTPIPGSGTATVPGSTTTTPVPTGPPQAITLPDGAASVYDPYGRATQKGDPAGALQDATSKQFSVTTPNDGKPMQVGLVVKLGASPHRVRRIEFATDTPGFRVEAYGATGSSTPPDILDTRWDHIASRARVDEDSVGANKASDGREILDLKGAGGEFRQVVLWFTTQADNGPTVDISSVKVLG